MFSCPGQGMREVVQLCPGMLARNGKTKATARRAAWILDKDRQYFALEQRPFEQECFAIVMGDT